MIPTEELRELAAGTHPLHGDLVRVCQELLAIREAKPAPTDHAALQALADKWLDQAKSAFLSTAQADVVRGCARELRPLLATALDELDRLRDELCDCAPNLKEALEERDALRAAISKHLGTTAKAWADDVRPDDLVAAGLYSKTEALRAEVEHLEKRLQQTTNALTSSITPDMTASEEPATYLPAVVAQMVEALTAAREYVNDIRVCAPLLELRQQAHLHLVNIDAALAAAKGIQK